MSIWTPERAEKESEESHKQCPKIVCGLDEVERCYHDVCKDHDWVGYGILMHSCSNCKQGDQARAEKNLEEKE